MANVLQERALYIYKRALYIRMYICKRNTCKRNLKYGMAGVLRTSLRTPVLNVRCSLLRGLRCELEDGRGDSNSSYNKRCSRYKCLVCGRQDHLLSWAYLRLFSRLDLKQDLRVYSALSRAKYLRSCKRFGSGLVWACYGLATVSRIDKIISLFCKRAR